MNLTNINRGSIKQAKAQYIAAAAGVALLASAFVAATPWHSRARVAFNPAPSLPAVHTFQAPQPEKHFVYFMVKSIDQETQVSGESYIVGPNTEVRSIMVQSPEQEAALREVVQSQLGRGLSADLIDLR